MARLSWPRGHP